MNSVETLIRDASARGRDDIVQDVIEVECICLDHPDNSNTSTFDGSWTPVRDCPLHGEVV